MPPETLLLINKILLWNGLFWLALYAYYVFVHKGVPNIQTSAEARKVIADLFRADMLARNLPNYTIVDVGSGNGDLTRVIAAAIPEARVIGIEISWPSVLWSNWMKRRVGLANLEYRRMDFFDYDFSVANGVMLYLLPVALKGLDDKLQQETQAGTYIICNRFAMRGGWVPMETIALPGTRLLEREIYLYRK
ncbi:MAG TPA: class I SAM-dependent methyltransferase [Alphaproteobacteria bacterium]|nr:hypothetical protein [Rhodospirillaceae bacterium]HRJ12314.1 class I SAM-dependent methyltransferase [Alphaproteobacteria bacterium]